MGQHTFYNNSSLKTKREVRKLIEGIVVQRKKQVEVIKNSVLKPLEANIKLKEQVINGTISIERFMEITEKVGKHLNGLFGSVKK